MSKRLRKAGLLWPTLFTAAALAVLVGLGSWQLERKSWKEGLITRLDARTHAAPVSLDHARELWRRTGDVEYLRVSVSGRFEHDKDQYYYAPDQKYGTGYHVYTPLVAENGETVWINRGFLPEQLKNRDKRHGADAEGATTVVGLARAPATPGLFTPDNDSRANLWYWRDLDGMTAAASGPAMDRSKVVPFFLEAEAEPANPGNWPKGGVTIVQLPNRHLEYAVTWFGLAATLIGVYVAFVLGRLRQAGS